MRSKKKIMPFFKYLALVIIIISVIALFLVKFLNILPDDYFWVLAVLLGVITIINVLLLVSRGPKKRALGTLLSLIYILLVIMGIMYLINTIDFLNKIGYASYKTENYSILVLSDSKYEDIKDLNKESIGSLVYNNDGIKKAKDKLNKKVELNYLDYNDITKLKNDFLDNKFKCLLIENSILAILDEEDEEFKNKYRVIYEFDLKVEVEDIKKDVDITQDSFNIFVSGIDTYGAVSSVSRSDVNMVITVNPKNNEALITSIPRDYYVELASKHEKDKFTHTGIYGIEESVKTIENLLNIKVNYYAKVNFSSLTKVVDALDGVSVFSEYDFTSIDGYTYHKGYNNVNGKEALSFVRERKSFASGDRVRIINQSEMVKAIVNKIMSPSIITNYNRLLNSLESSFITNMSSNDLTKFIKKQASDMPKWTISNYSLDGYDDYQYTYSYKGQKLYVMRPNEETIINAKNKINEIINKEL